MEARNFKVKVLIRKFSITLPKLVKIENGDSTAPNSLPCHLSTSIVQNLPFDKFKIPGSCQTHWSLTFVLLDPQLFKIFFYTLKCFFFFFFNFYFFFIFYLKAVISLNCPLFSIIITFSYPR